MTLILIFIALFRDDMVAFLKSNKVFFNDVMFQVLYVVIQLLSLIDNNTLIRCSVKNILHTNFFAPLYSGRVQHIQRGVRTQNTTHPIY